MIRVIVSGAAGKMGSSIIRLIHKDSDLKLVGAVESQIYPDLDKDICELLHVKSCGVLLQADLSKLKNYDVLIEFSNASTTLEHLKTAVSQKKPMVIGTTGFNEVQFKELVNLAKKIPCVISPNMSIGMNVLLKLSELTAKVLGNECDIEIVEAHHTQKKDAPSGSAKKLAEAVKSQRKGEIAIHALRIGDVVGDHTVFFAGSGERLELKHQAHTRDIFALGALRAAKFIVKKSAGIYNMADVLGL